MHFNKPPTTIDEQIDPLIERAMQGDAALMRRWLETVGYNRLSAHWLPFEVLPTDDKTRSKRFAADLQFDTIVDIFVFDRKLRLLVMEAIERIEIAVQSSWTNRPSRGHGSHAHLDTSVFHSGCDHIGLLSALVNRVKTWGKSQRKSTHSSIRKRSKTLCMSDLPPLKPWCDQICRD